MKKHSLALSILLTGTFLVTTISSAGYTQVVVPQNLINQTQQQSGAGKQYDSTDLTLPEDQQKEKQKLDAEGDDTEKVEIDAPEPPQAQKLQSAKFLVNDVSVTGVSVFEDEEIEAIVSEFEGQNLTLEDLGGLVDQINQLYRSQGYLTTQAYIPPQDIEGGNVQIEVLEGHIGTIAVTGNKFYKTWMLERNIPQEPGDVLNIRDLEDALNRINQQENFRLKAVLSPGSQTGDTDIRLELAERQPWQIAGTFDNQGRPFIGFYRYGAEVTSQNMTGIGDKFYARWIGAHGKRTNVALAGYTLPLNRHGTELSYNFAYSRVNPHLGLRRGNPDIRGTAVTHQALITQPLDKNRTFVADAGFNWKYINSYSNIGSKSSVMTRTGRVQIASMQAGVNFDKVDRFGRTFARTQVTVAPDWGSKRYDQFMKLESFFQRLVRLPKNNLLILRGNWHYSPHELTPAEQMQIGGAFSVRGYTEGLLSGDRGWSFGVEDRFPIPGLRKLSPYLADRVQGAVFFDYGQTWLDRKNALFIQGVSNTLNRQLLMSVGGGFRARLNRYAQGFVDLSWGLVNRTSVEPTRSGHNMRVHFGIRSELLPDKLKEHDTGEAEIIKEAFGSKAEKKLAKKEAKARRKAAKKQAKEVATENIEAPVADAEMDASLNEVFGANAVDEELFSSEEESEINENESINFDVINLDVDDSDEAEGIPTSSAF